MSAAEGSLARLSTVGPGRYPDPMQALPRSTVLFAAGAICLSAVAGGYLGVARSLSAPGGPSEEAALAAAPVTPVASAKPILAPAMDEEEVRRLAREEASTLLAKSQPKRLAKAPEADDEADEPQLTPIVPPAGLPAAPKPQAAQPPASIPF